MKNTISKITAFFLALVTVFSLCTVVYADSEQKDDFLCGGVIEEADIRIVYIPLKSKIVFGNTEPDFEGMVIKVTYPDGKNEFLTVEKIRDYYYAGDFHITVWDNTELDGRFKIKSFTGFEYVSKTIYFDTEIKNQIGYYDTVDFVCFKIPSPAEFFQNISALFSMSFA